MPNLSALLSYNSVLWEALSPFYRWENWGDQRRWLVSYHTVSKSWFPWLNKWSDVPTKMPTHHMTMRFWTGMAWQCSLLRSEGCLDLGRHVQAGTVGFVSKAKLNSPMGSYLPVSYHPLDKSRFWKLSHPQTLSTTFACSILKYKI